MISNLNFKLRYQIIRTISILKYAIFLDFILNFNQSTTSKHSYNNKTSLRFPHGWKVGRQVEQLLTFFFLSGEYPRTRSCKQFFIWCETSHEKASRNLTTIEISAAWGPRRKERLKKKTAFFFQTLETFILFWCPLFLLSSFL